MNNFGFIILLSIFMTLMLTIGGMILALVDLKRKQVNDMLNAEKLLAANLESEKDLDNYLNKNYGKENN